MRQLNKCRTTLSRIHKSTWKSIISIIECSIDETFSLDCMQEFSKFVNYNSNIAMQLFHNPQIMAASHSYYISSW
jgi:hypothetical protein